MSSKDLQQTPTQPNPVANTSPITKVTAAQVTDDLGFASPVGGAIKVVASPPRRLPALPPWWWDPNGPPNQAPPKEIPEHEAETPPKTVLPAGYDATTGTTPLGAAGWQIDNRCLSTDRPGVPGHTEAKAFCLATPTRDSQA